jgi:hypothetical protein
VKGRRPYGAAAVPALIALWAGLGACRATSEYAGRARRLVGVERKLVDPVLVVRSAQGEELGVGTVYGPVFLGRHARAGEIEIQAWFGDGPALESSVVEPLGHGLYTAATEIRLPSVPLSFALPEAGSSVLVLGRAGGELWRRELRVARHPKLRGLLLDYPAVLSSDEAIGAGVFVPGRRGEDDLQLLGVLCGRIEIEDGAETDRFLVALGPEDLWHLVAWRRDWSPKPRWVYREDVM